MGPDPGQGARAPRVVAFGGGHGLAAALAVALFLAAWSLPLPGSLFRFGARPVARSGTELAAHSPVMTENISAAAANAQHRQVET